MTYRNALLLLGNEWFARDFMHALSCLLPAASAAAASAYIRTGSVSVTGYERASREERALLTTREYLIEQHPTCTTLLVTMRRRKCRMDAAAAITGAPARTCPRAWPVIEEVVSAVVSSAPSPSCVAVPPHSRAHVRYMTLSHARHGGQGTAMVRCDVTR